MYEYTNGKISTRFVGSYAKQFVRRGGFDHPIAGLVFNKPLGIRITDMYEYTNEKISSELKIWAKEEPLYPFNIHNSSFRPAANPLIIISRLATISKWAISLKLNHSLLIEILNE